MIAKHKQGFSFGYNSVAELAGEHADMLLDFGILKLRSGESWVCDLGLERAWMLIQGTVEFRWPQGSSLEMRTSCIDEPPVVLHAPGGIQISVVAITDCELVVERCVNAQDFPVCLYRKDDVRTDIFGAGTLQETSTRTVRTVFDGDSAPYSNMVMGEVITHPGKWSSYPPHNHPHPEIYHYRFFPSQGFGISVIDDDAFVVHDGDSSMIPPHKTHSQSAAPGYAMYYIWLIPHLPHDRWLPSTRFFRKEHEWLLTPEAKIWPEVPAVMA